jgi:Family of unknown function (DUF5317)
MVLAEAAIAGILLGLLSGGRLAALAELGIRRVELVYAAILLQIGAFPSGILPWSTPDRIARGLWLASFALLIGFATVNRAVRGVALVFAGLASNLAAVAANGGLMPASPHAIGAAGLTYRLHNNSISNADPRLAWLTDRWAVPNWIPWGNVFSVGDVLIAAGIIVTIVLAMHGRARRDAASSSMPQKPGLDGPCVGPWHVSQARRVPPLPNGSRACHATTRGSASAAALSPARHL